METPKQTKKSEYIRLFSAAILIFIAAGSLFVSIMVAKSTSDFTTQCNDHWQAQIETVCMVPNIGTYEWISFNRTAPFPIPELQTIGGEDNENTRTK